MPTRPSANLPYIGEFSLQPHHSRIRQHSFLFPTFSFDRVLAHPLPAGLTYLPIYYHGKHAKERQSAPSNSCKRIYTVCRRSFLGLVQLSLPRLAGWLAGRQQDGYQAAYQEFSSKEGIYCPLEYETFTGIWDGTQWHFSRTISTAL
jgi:hypothetical protein